MSSKALLRLELGAYQATFDKALKAADEANISSRIWKRDHSLWSDSSEEISDRLGWLDIARRMSTEISDLQNFAEEVKASGISQVLLLGMGGSSLAPEVFSKIFGRADGCPSLAVLDSTDPDAVRAMQKAHSASGTLYIVSTKSGGTVETLSFFKTFYSQATDELGKDRAGKHFVAITDPGSKLATLAEKHNFRRTFLNDPHIGGRYSALSYFGLVPAALLDVDLGQVLDRALQMAELCGPELPDSENPGVQLGIALSRLAKSDRDKVSFITPAEISSFGDWAEQLIAESSGKSGTGILPVVGEAVGRPDDYGDDRVFINLSISGKQDNQKIATLQAAGHPVIHVQWQDIEDLGGQFFLWEFATAVAGYGLGINPFDQPNVESAKVQGRLFVEAYAESGNLPVSENESLSSSTLSLFLERSKPGDYVALQAYVQPTEQTFTLLQQLRQKLLKKYRLATTLGFGPRFLHSTGQLHKGDGGNGLFIQFVSMNKDDLAIPIDIGSDDSEISYGILKKAQALGDAKALREAGRRVLTFTIEGELESELAAFVDGYK